MQFFRSRGRPTDPLWEVASATQIFAAAPHAMSSWAFDTDIPRPDVRLDGALIANRHPTGWFLHAVRRKDLPEAQLAAFRELVTVRSYLLLAYGPQAPAWLPSPTEGEWRSVSFSIERELAELDAALVE